MSVIDILISICEMLSDSDSDSDSVSDDFPHEMLSFGNDSGSYSDTGFFPSEDPQGVKLKFQRRRKLRKGLKESQKVIPKGRTKITRQGMAKALVCSEGNKQTGELNLRAGEFISVLKEHIGEQWLMVRNSRGEQGLIPKHFVERLYSDSDSDSDISSTEMGSLMYPLSKLTIRTKPSTGVSTDQLRKKKPQDW